MDAEVKTSRLMSLADEKIVAVDWALVKAREVGGVI